MTQAYGELATIYERFMVDAPYDAWMQWLDTHIPDLSRCTVADLGCGTGTLTRRLAQRAWRVMGIDASDAMLAVAAERALAEQVRVEWLCQDLRELRLPAPADLLVSTCDSFNYLLSPTDLGLALAAAYRNLKPGGWLCFDVLGPARLVALKAGLSYELDDDAAVLFESTVGEGGEITYEVHAFIRLDNGDYRRIQERHRQQFFSAADLAEQLAQIGFTSVAFSGDFGASDLGEADRLIVTARRPE
jgi:SAM-dependent methyltransferase